MSNVGKRVDISNFDVFGRGKGSEARQSDSCGARWCGGKSQSDARPQVTFFLAGLWTGWPRLAGRFAGRPRTGRRRTYAATAYAHTLSGVCRRCKSRVSWRRTAATNKLLTEGPYSVTSVCPSSLCACYQSYFWPWICDWLICWKLQTTATVTPRDAIVKIVEVRSFPPWYERRSDINAYRHWVLHPTKQKIKTLLKGHLCRSRHFYFHGQSQGMQRSEFEWVFGARRWRVFSPEQPRATCPRPNPGRGCGPFPPHLFFMCSDCGSDCGAIRAERPIATWF